jgi:hypothetical protein
LAALVAFAGYVPSGGFEIRLKIWFYIISGPLQECYLPQGFKDMLIWSPVLAAAILFHPIRPNRFTGIVSAVGLAFWFLTGLGLTFVGV